MAGTVQTLQRTGCAYLFLDVPKAREPHPQVPGQRSDRRQSKEGERQEGYRAPEHQREPIRGTQRDLRTGMASGRSDAKDDVAVGVAPNRVRGRLRCARLTDAPSRPPSVPESSRPPPPGDLATRSITPSQISTARPAYSFPLLRPRFAQPCAPAAGAGWPAARSWTRRRR